jgi:putative PIN family toxin of toxin-antitoxin system
MRVVLDTNVLVSAIFWRGAPHQILQAWAEGKIEILCSIPILDEYRRVLEDFGKDLPDFELGAWMRFIFEHAIFINPSISLSILREDPADNRFLECAISGKADAIISGDQHLKSLRHFEGVDILSPSEFLKKLD